MSKDTSRDLDLAHAFAGVLSGREFGTLKVVVGDKIGYHQESDTIILPGIPFGDVAEETKEDLRAYIAHESIGERGHSKWLPKDYPDERLKRIINGMNDARIDRIALREWPGAGMSIRSRLKKDWAYFQKVVGSGKMGVKNPGVLSSALRYVGENIATVEEISAVTPELASLFQRLAPALASVNWDGTEEHIIDRAKEVCRLAELEEEEREETPPPPPEKGKSGAGDGESDEGGGKEKGEAPKKEKAKESPASGKPVKPSTGGSDKPVKDSTEPFGSMEDRLKENLHKLLDPASVTKGTQVFTIPPRSIKRRPTPKGGEAETDKPTRATVGRVMRLFRQLQAAEDRVILRHQLLGELDPNSLGDLHRGSMRLFSARKRSETESLAVYISVDLTGSMGSLWPRGGVQRAVLAFNEALGRLEIPTAIVGWSGYRNQVEYRKYTQPYETHFTDMKTFDDSWQAGAVAISKTTTGSANTDVPALGDAISQLARRPETRKLLFYLTDGQPCLDWSPDFEVEHGLLGRTMRQMVEKAKRAGIVTMACGIDLRDTSRLTMERIFGVDNYAEVHGNMEEALGPQFEKAVKRIMLRQERGMQR